MLNTFNELIKIGVQSENIYRLAADFQNLREYPLLKEKSGLLFRENCSAATLSNLIRANKEIAAKMTATDTLIVIITGISLGDCIKTNSINSETIDMKCMSGIFMANPSKNNLFIFNTSFASQLIESSFCKGTYIGATVNGVLWTDNNLYYPVLYLKCLGNQLSDLNLDGHITYKEAFDHAAFLYHVQGERTMAERLVGYSQEPKEIQRLVEFNGCFSEK